MKFVHYQLSESPHVIPLIARVADILGVNEVHYIGRGKLQADRVAMGWNVNRPDWLIYENERPDEAREWIENCPVMICGMREIDLFERRSSRGLKSFYTSERWFKPYRIYIAGVPFVFPWWLRLLSPRFARMAWKMVRLLKTGNGFIYAAIGIHAATDMARLVGFFSGDLRCLFAAPKLTFERKPFGNIYDSHGRLIPWMSLTGYFVEPTKYPSRIRQQPATNNQQLTTKVLWVGRMIDWKRVDTLVKAVVLANRQSSQPILLTLVGSGLEKPNLQKFVAKLCAVNQQPITSNQQPLVAFRDSLPISEIRSLMREHDVYVLPSDGGEGWGAVINEALEEEMCVLGTYEAGASATLLPDGNLFHAGDYECLAEMLLKVVKERSSESSLQFITPIGEWSANEAAKLFVEKVERCR